MKNYTIESLKKYNIYQKQWEKEKVKREKMEGSSAYIRSPTTREDRRIYYQLIEHHKNYI